MASINFGLRRKGVLFEAPDLSIYAPPYRLQLFVKALQMYIRCPQASIKVVIIRVVRLKKEPSIEYSGQHEKEINN